MHIVEGEKNLSKKVYLKVKCKTGYSLALEIGYPT